MHITTIGLDLVKSWFQVMASTPTEKLPSGASCDAASFACEGRGGPVRVLEGRERACQRLSHAQYFCRSKHVPSETAK
jgi:hypothetical protein